MRRRPGRHEHGASVQMLRLGAHAELRGERGDAVLRGPDPVRAHVGAVATDVVGAHLAADAVARLEDRRPSGRRRATRRAALRPLRPAADDRDVEGSCAGAALMGAR